MVEDLSRAGLIQFIYDQPVTRLVNDREDWGASAVGDYAWAQGVAPIDTNEEWMAWLHNVIIWPLNSVPSLLRWVLRGKPILLNSDGKPVDLHWESRRRPYGDLQKQLKSEGFPLGWKGEECAFVVPIV